MRSDMIPGAHFPDLELPDHTDTPRKLSFLQGNDPMLLTLHRGIYCPKERQLLHQDLREVTRKIWLDWQADTAEMRSRWQQGDKEGFYPYGRSWQQVFMRMAGEVDQCEEAKR